MYYVSGVRVSRTKYFQILCLNVLNHVTSAPGVCAVRELYGRAGCRLLVLRGLAEARQTDASHPRRSAACRRDAVQ